MMAKKTHYIGCYVEDDLKRRLQKQADGERISTAAVIRRALDRYCEKEPEVKQATPFD